MHIFEYFRRLSVIAFKWVGEKQKEYGIDSMQLLFYQAPLSALLLSFVIPFFEPIKGENGVFTNDWGTEALVNKIHCTV